MRPVLLAACLLLAGCGDQPPGEADVARAVTEAVEGRRDLQSRFVDSRIGLASAVSFATPTSVRLVGAPQLDETTGRWLVRVAMSGSFSATLPPPAVAPAKPAESGRFGPPAAPASPAKPQRISADYDVRFQTYLDRDGGVWCLP